MGERSRFLAGSAFKLYLFGFRWFGLLLAFLLTRFNTPEGQLLNPLPDFLSQEPMLLNGVIIFYHLGASIFAFRRTENRLAIYLLMLGDAGLGLLLSYYFGLPYLFLALGLPALEAAYFLGLTASIFTLLLTGAFYLPSIAAQILKQLQDPVQSRVLLEVLKVNGVLFALFLWLFWLAIYKEEDNFFTLQRLGEERNLLFEELESTKREFKEVFNELEKRQHIIDQLKLELQKTREEMEDLYKKLHEARLKTQATQQMVQEKETQISQRLSQDTQMLEKKIILTRKLIESFKHLAKSLTLEETSINIVDELLKLLPVQTCLLFLMEETQEGEILFAEVAASPYSDYFRNFSLAQGEGAPGWVVFSRKPLLINDGAVLIEDDMLPTLLTYEKSALVVPLIYEEEVLGVLYLGQPQPRAFTTDDLELLENFAILCANILHNVILFQKMVAEGFMDAGSGLYNSNYFNERVPEELKRARRYNYTVSLALLGIDGFTELAEINGKSFIEDSLKEVSAAIRSNTRETDVAARLGENIFALLTLQTDKTQALLSADRVRMSASVRELTGEAGEKVKITLSCGVASFPADAPDRDSLLQKAMEALEKAWQSGGNTSIGAA